METKELEKRIYNAVKDFTEYEETFSDNAQIRINPLTGEVEIADPDDDLDGFDYYPAMDLVEMSVETPGKWIPDAEAIAEVAAEYLEN